MVTIKVRVIVTYVGRESYDLIGHMEWAFGVRGRVLFLDLGCSYKGVHFITY